MTTYREEAKVKCQACQRIVAAVRPIEKREPASAPMAVELLVSRHLYQEGVDVNGLGLPILNAAGFCPGSFNPAKEPIRTPK